MDSFESLSFFRGVSASYGTDAPLLHTTRLDRRPRGSGKVFHEAADSWFLHRFGVSFRSQALFAASSISSVLRYASTPKHVMRVLPLSDYKFCWSPKVEDLIVAAVRFTEAPTKVVWDYLDSCDYQATALRDAHSSGHEIMVSAERFVLVPANLIGVDTSAIRPGLIVCLDKEW
jgi:hypothetical protein